MNCLTPNYDIDDTAKKYMKEIKPYTSLKKDEEHKLLKAYKKNHDLSARNKLITSNLKYTCKLANKYRNRGVPFSHLISEANEALFYAIEKFDDKQDVKLMSYAKWWINQRLNALIDDYKKMPTDDLPTEHDSQQLNDNVNYAQEYDMENEYINSAFLNDEDEYDKDTKVIIDELYNKLDEREIDIVNMKFGRSPYEKEYTLEEIGQKYKLTKERVRQIFEKAMTKMRSQAMLMDNKFLAK